MTTRKKWTEPVHDLGEWDTSVTDDPPDELEALPVSVTPVPVTTPSPRVRVTTPSRAERRRSRTQGASDEAPPEPEAVASEPAPAGPELPNDPTRVTAIGASIVVRGRLTTRENLVVHGRVDAAIRSTCAVRIERSGVVNANMDVASAAIDGILVGNVRAADLIELLPNARVVGDLNTRRLIVHEGALLRGRVDMDGLQALEILEQSPPPAPPVQSKRPPQKVTIEPPRGLRADVIDWDEPEIVAPAAVRVEPIAARVPADPAAVKADYRAPRPEGPPPSKLEPAAPPPRPRPAATAKSPDKPDPAGGDKGGWYRGRQ